MHTRHGLAPRGMKKNCRTLREKYMDQYTIMPWKNVKEETMKIYDKFTINQVYNIS